jgi:hypothetical protein
VSNHRFVALDTQFLLDLENGDETCESVIDALARIPVFFIVTETVLQELADVKDHAESPEVRRHAGLTIERLGTKCFIAPELQPVVRGVAEIVAQNVLPLLSDGTKNDGLILAESACHNCRLLVTSRQQILSGNCEAIRLALIRSDVGDVVALSPQSILDAFRQLKQSGGKAVIPESK